MVSVRKKQSRIHGTEMIDVYKRQVCVCVCVCVRARVLVTRHLLRLCFQADTSEEKPNNEEVEEIVQTGGQNVSEKDTPPPPVNVPERTSKRKYSPMPEEAYSVMKKIGSNLKKKTTSMCWAGMSPVT